MFKPTRMRWRRETEGEVMFRIEIENNVELEKRRSERK